MTKNNKALYSGVVLLVLGGITLIIEQVTNYDLSGMLGKLYCGETYLKAVSQPGDGMCGFNMDMVVGMASFLLLAAGLVFLVIGAIKAIARRKKLKTM